MSYLHAIAAALAAIFASIVGGQDAAQHYAAVRAPALAVVLSRDDAIRLGIVTEPAQAARFTPRIHGYGVVVDPSQLAQMESDIATAAAASRQSDSDLRRARALYAYGDGAIAVQALDAAEKQAASDRAALALAERKETAQFGREAPWHAKGGSASTIVALYRGNAVLVEATFPLGSPFGARPQSLSAAHLTHAPSDLGWTSKRIWHAPADPTIPGRSFYALIERSDLEQGEHVLVYAPVGAPITGVRVPASAVVLSGEKTWCYVEIAPGRFSRIALDTSRPVSDGYFVESPIRAGEPIVVRGTGLLLARELGAAPGGY